VALGAKMAANWVEVVVLAGIGGDVAALNRVVDHLHEVHDGFDAVLVVGPLQEGPGVQPAGVAEERAWRSRHEAETSTVLSIIESLAPTVMYVPGPTDGPSLRQQNALGDYPILAIHALNIHQRSAPWLPGLHVADAAAAAGGHVLLATTAAPSPLPALHGAVDTHAVRMRGAQRARSVGAGVLTVEGSSCRSWRR
jgi:hypothetical protein